MRFKITTRRYGSPDEQDLLIVPTEDDIPTDGSVTGYYDRTLTVRQALDLAEALRYAANAVLKLDAATPKAQPEPEPETDGDDTE